MLPNLIIVLLFAGYVLFKAKSEVHIAQQNSYFNSRYWDWLQKNKRKRLLWWEIVPFVAIIALALTIQNHTLISALAALGFGYGIYFYFTEKHIKPVVFTPRVRRLYGVLLIFFSIILYFSYSDSCQMFCAWRLLLGAILSPLLLLLANLVLQPVENSINQGFVTDAKRKLQSMPNLKVIGITGSYGKTSVKHFVARILAEKYNVLHTPGSVNTTLGVVRIIREQLKSTHEVFIAEMGAKKLGDVKEISELVQPQYAILTAIGPEHLDTFGSMENVQKGNFELPESVSASGMLLLNGDYDLVRQYNKNNAPKIWYSTNENQGDYVAKNIQYTGNGMSFEVWYKNELFASLETKLLGDHNASNICVAVAIANELGVEKGRIAYAVRNLQPVKHRMEIKPNPNGITIIDDAFNSNPTGARMALEVLKKIQGNKKIIITPGMIELADEEYEFNKQFGKQIAAACDYVILVGQRQTIPIQDGLREANYPEAQLYVARNLMDASTHLRTFVGIGDVVLYENDLPDTYKE
jgi:UDP-N-acetylmuramoyl-tripeptide--D-alanyl-D-alanine ligase